MLPQRCPRAHFLTQTNIWSQQFCNIALYKKLNFDPAALESVAVLSKIPNLLLVRQDFPAKTVAEFIVYAEAHPSQGPGTTSQLSGEQFSQLLGARMVHVPYRGTGPALNDLIGGQVDCMITELATAYKLHTGGKPRILAVATERRLDDLPDIPTVIEAGVPGFLSGPGMPSARHRKHLLPSLPSSTGPLTRRSTSRRSRNDTGNCIFCPVAAARRTWRSSRRKRRSAGPG